MKTLELLAEVEVDVLQNAIDRRIEEIEENLKMVDTKASRTSYQEEKNILEKLFDRLK